MGGCWCWGDDAVSFERPYPEIGFWDAFLRIVAVQLEVLGGLAQELGEERECPVNIPSGGWQEAETLTLNRGMSRPGVAEKFSVQQCANCISPLAATLDLMARVSSNYNKG